MYVCLYLYKYVNICVCVCIYIFGIYIYIYIYIYLYIYIDILSKIDRYIDILFKICSVSSERLQCIRNVSDSIFWRMDAAFLVQKLTGRDSGNLMSSSSHRASEFAGEFLFAQGCQSYCSIQAFD